MHRRIFLFVFFVTGGLPAFSQNSMQLTDMGKIVVNGQLSYLPDASESLSFDAVKEMEFVPYISKYSPNIGFDRSPHWFKLDITNASSSTEWLLEVAYSPLDQIDVYFIGPEGTYIHKTDGDHYPISERDLQHRHPVFSFNIDPGQTQDVYVRVKSISSVQVPITFWHREGFLKTQYKVQLLNGLFMGPWCDDPVPIVSLSFGQG